MTTPNNKNESKNKYGVSIWLTAIVAIIITSLVSWLMISNLAAPKTAYASDITRIDNSMNHITDSASSLNSFTDYQNTLISDLKDSTQTQFDDINNSITDTNNALDQAQTDTTASIAGVQNQVNGLKTQADALGTQTNQLGAQAAQLGTQLGNQITTVSQKADSTKTSLDTLTAKVNGLAGGMRITPTVSGSTITLSISSDVAQSLAFNVEFRPTSDVPTTLATMDAALASLYATPPVTLVAGSAIRGDYTLYWSTSDTSYHVGTITFMTMRTSIAAGSNTKTMSFSFTGSYEILITPIYPTGTTTGSW